MKVLLIAAGRRVSLATRFKSHRFDVFSYETEVKCPISTVAQIIEGKGWDEPDIRKHIEDTIDRIKPDLVLPLADKATAILSDISYKGIVSSSKYANNICLNKKLFEEKFCESDFYPNIDCDHKIIWKPIYGANSKGLKIMKFDDLMYKENIHNDCIAQRFIDGFEISVDAYFNKSSQMVDAVPRKRIEVQGGEVCRSITMERDAYGVVQLTKEIGEKIGLVGPICAQYIIDNNKPYIMEINARFGGGVILSLEAGFDMVRLLKKEYVDNEKVEPQEHNWKVGFGMTRYFSEYFYE